MNAVTAIATIEEPQVLRDLNRYHDRCDRCDAQAWVLAVKARKGESDAELLFCVHHSKAKGADGKAHLEVLQDKGWTIRDDSELVNGVSSQTDEDDDEDY